MELSGLFLMKLVLIPVGGQRANSSVGLLLVLCLRVVRYSVPLTCVVADDLLPSLHVMSAVSNVRGVATNYWFPAKSD